MYVFVHSSGWIEWLINSGQYFGRPSNLEMLCHFSLCIGHFSDHVTSRTTPSLLKVG